MRLTRFFLTFSLAMASYSATGDIPVAYDVVELDALERLPQQDGSTTRPTSFAYTINNNGLAAGSSVGKISVTSSRVVNGITVVETSEQDLLQAIDFNNTMRTFMPTDGTFGFGVEGRGVFGSSINESNIISGHGFSRFEITTFDITDDCAELRTDNREVRQGFVLDLADQLTLIEPTFVSGQPLGSEHEYLSSFLLDSNDNYSVGFVERVTAKDECGNIDTLANRGLIYDLRTGEIALIEPLEQSENADSARTFIEGINSQNQFVGWGDTLDENETRIAVGLIGEVGSTELVEVPGLDGATRLSLRDLDNNGEFAVGASNKTSRLNALTAFYYDFTEQQPVEIGYLSSRFENSQAFAINDDLLVVGVSQISSTPTAFAPFIYDIDASDPQPINLNTLIDCDSGWTLSEARDINEGGVIVGTGTVVKADNDGVERAEIRGFKLMPRATAAKQDCNNSSNTDNSSGSLPLAVWALLLLGALRGRGRR